MSVVGGVPLMTELVPAARSLVMSIVLAMGGLGRGVGALIGPQIMDSWGFEGLGIISALAMLLAIIILVKSIREAEEAPYTW
jgi:predicted MFS family arabinose efflux permease